MSEELENEDFLPYELEGRGRPATRSLFWDIVFSHENAQFVIKTPKGRTIDGIWYPSLYQLYLEEVHVPCEGEYDFAIKYFGTWEAWEAVCRSPSLKPYIAKMRNALEQKVRSDALKKLIDVDKTEALKYFADGNWKPKTKGRPTKEKLEEEEETRANVRKAAKSHLELIQGSK